MRARVIIGWVLLGVAGVALAVGITMTATSLTSQRIGLASEPLTAGEELVPTATIQVTRTTVRTTPARTTPARTTPTRTVTDTTVAPPPTTTRQTETGDDHGGRGGDDGGGDGDYDD